MMSKNPVQVYCRLRPMQSPTDVSCIRVTSDTTVVVTKPESGNFRPLRNKERQSTFTHVFTSDVTQREIFETVAHPLVENLIHGRNGLLFTYGATGSGKTYTITGERQDPGIIPRCLDVIFNSIANYRTKKFFSKPNKINGFDVQNEADAMLDRQHELHADPSQRTGRLGKRWMIDSDGDSNPTVAYERNKSQSVAIEPDNAYAVIVTFVEIYHSNVSDLLYDDDITSKHKIAIEDRKKNMYEHTEVEVKTAEEAFELFQRGQQKRRLAHTLRRSNARPNNSHGVFTIRLVQTPSDCESEYVMQDKRIVCVSQLSLVDFVGYENWLAKDFNQRWQEAGNLFNALPTLRSYLEILREDQDTNKMDPHGAFSFPRSFKNCFDWQGQVRMIVCVNPREDDYNNTFRGMRLMEIAQGVYIETDKPLELNGFTLGRRQANKDARSKLEKGGRPEASDLDIEFEQLVMAVEQENVNLKANTQQKRKISALEGHLRKMETQIVYFLRIFNETTCSLQQKMRNYTEEIEDKLCLGKQILVDDNDINPVIVPSKEQELTTRVISPDRDSRMSRKDRISVSNPSYRRSRSAEIWIDHRSQTLVPIRTALQPLMQKRRSVTRLTSSKGITDGASRYCLVAQEHDTDGELETKLYKADILPTSGDGSQVVFNDMECLKPSSPKRRKRTGPREEGNVDQVDFLH